jgi:hypothetical protein
MKWRFWRKDNPLAALDPHMLAYVMVQNMVGHKPPFNMRRDKEDAIPERFEPLIEISVNVYQLSIFLDFLERKFGSDVAGIVKSHIIALMNKGKVGAIIHRFFSAVEVGRATPEREQFWAHNPAVQVDCNVAKAFLALAAETQEEKDAIYPLMGKSLSLGRVSAEAAFGHLVESIEFRPETIFGLRKPQDISVNWSDTCGCFERHLQRRYLNALFPLERRGVSVGEIAEARAKDIADLKKFKTDVGKVIKEISSPPDELPFDEVLHLRKTIEHLLIRAAEIGPIANQLRDDLKALYKLVVESLRKACPPEHKSEFDELTADSVRYQQKWTNYFLAQFRRSDKPIPGDEIISSLLTEDVETVRVVASTLEETVRKDMYDLAVALVADAQKEGYTVPQAEEKLRTLRNRA